MVIYRHQVSFCSMLIEISRGCCVLSVTDKGRRGQQPTGLDLVPGLHLSTSSQVHNAADGHWTVDTDSDTRTGAAQGVRDRVVTFVGNNN